MAGGGVSSWTPPVTSPGGHYALPLYPPASALLTICIFMTLCFYFLSRFLQNKLVKHPPKIQVCKKYTIFRSTLAYFDCFEPFYHQGPFSFVWEIHLFLSHHFILVTTQKALIPDRWAGNSLQSFCAAPGPLCCFPTVLSPGSLVGAQWPWPALPRHPWLPFPFWGSKIQALSISLSLTSVSPFLSVLFQTGEGSGEAFIFEPGGTCQGKGNLSSGTSNRTLMDQTSGNTKARDQLGYVHFQKYFPSNKPLCFCQRNIPSKHGSPIPQPRTNVGTGSLT